MYDFYEWLMEAKATNIQFGGFWKDGRVIVYIGPKRYEYITDAVYHEKWKRMVPYSPGRVLNQIKDMVKYGWAKQVEPPPVQKTQKLERKPAVIKNGPSSENSCPNCGTPEPHYVSGIECPGCGLNTSA